MALNLDQMLMEINGNKARSLVEQSDKQAEFFGNAAKNAWEELYNMETSTIHESDDGEKDNLRLRSKLNASVHMESLKQGESAHEQAGRLDSQLWLSLEDDAQEQRYFPKTTEMAN
ncbi:MAG: hypothetical protein FWE16_04645 [Firmicutes bacterium]|nr:hypothetical protein [Bacillota bacterium]